MLHERISKVKSSSVYFPKDLHKASLANKFIGSGSARSSTNKYMVAAGDLANCGVYTEHDRVFISAEGLRAGRIPPNFDEIQLALNAKATIITDHPSDRARNYNIGERQVANFLALEGYVEVYNGVWKPSS